MYLIFYHVQRQINNNTKNILQLQRICSADSRVITIVAKIFSVLICNVVTPAFFFFKKGNFFNYHVMAKYNMLFISYVLKQSSSLKQYDRKIILLLISKDYSIYYVLQNKLSTALQSYLYQAIQSSRPTKKKLRTISLCYKELFLMTSYVTKDRHST